jgi:ATP-binding protein involved in chromosome partitioning
LRRPHDIFGHGGARDEAARIGTPFLGEVPLSMPIRETSDAGRPVVATAPDGPHAKVYLEIAAKVRARLDELSGAGGRAMPDIVFE